MKVAQKTSQSFDTEIKQIKAELQYQIRSNETLIELTLAGFLAGGHVILEGLPGTGKTSLAKCLAGVFGGEFRRIQMTSDLLPSDIVGIVRLQPGSSEFEFRKGPIFANFVLADELNRTPPKTQSALLEAMAEGTVTVDGVTHLLPNPFFVIATQNPLESQGVYALAESQLDRFMLKLVMDRPGRDEELRIYEDFARGGSERRTQVRTPFSIDRTLAARAEIARVNIDRSVAEYATDIIRKSLTFGGVAAGPSVRAGLQMMACARALAFVRERDFVTPREILDLAAPVLGHRLLFRDEERSTQERLALVDEVAKSVPAPV
jgi:MoxR-like ATPase